MFFANGQGFNVVMKINDESYLVHEPLPVLPGADSYMFYSGQKYYVSEVMYVYSGYRKPTVYISCEACS